MPDDFLEYMAFRDDVIDNLADSYSDWEAAGNDPDSFDLEDLTEDEVDEFLRKVERKRSKKR